MGLPHFERQAFIEGVPEQETVDETRVNAGNTHDSTPSYSSNALAKGFASTALKFEGGEHGLSGAPFGFKANGIDHAIYAAHAWRLTDDGVCWVIVLIEIDRDGAVGSLGIIQAVRVVIDHKDTVSPSMHATAALSRPTGPAP